MKKYAIVPTLAIFMGVALLIGAVINANAGHHGHSMMTSNMSQIDTNNDGVISFDEYAAFHSEKLRWSFNALDTDNDGSISSNEWDMFLKMHGFGKGYGKNDRS